MLHIGFWLDSRLKMLNSFLGQTFSSVMRDKRRGTATFFFLNRQRAPTSLTRKKESEMETDRKQLRCSWFLAPWRLVVFLPRSIVLLIYVYCLQCISSWTEVVNMDQRCFQRYNIILQYLLKSQLYKSVSMPTIFFFSSISISKLSFTRKPKIDQGNSLQRILYNRNWRK